MADEAYLARLEEWADKVLDDSRRLPEDLPEEEARKQEALWYADFYALQDEVNPDDPAMRAWLIEEEGMSPDLADEVLAKLRELTAAR